MGCYRVLILKLDLIDPGMQASPQISADLCLGKALANSPLISVGNSPQFTVSNSPQITVGNSPQITVCPHFCPLLWTRKMKERKLVPT